MIKYLLPKGLLEKSHFHGDDLDMQQFAKDFIPKTHLPKELDGDLESVEILHKQTCEKLMSLQDYFMAEEKILFDEISDEMDVVNGGRAEEA